MSISTNIRAALAASLILVAVLATAPIASAGTATAVGQGAIVYEASPGQANTITVTMLQPNLVKFTDSAATFATMTANTGCKAFAGPPVIMLCTNQYIAQVDVHGYDGDDQLIMTPGSGADTGVWFEGGAGNDTLIGGDGNDSLYGGSYLTPHASDGADTVTGGPGGDSIITGDCGDTVTGGAGGDRIYLLGGNVTADGGADDDEFYARESDCAQGDDLKGGTGNDRFDASGASGLWLNNSQASGWPADVPASVSLDDVANDGPLTGTPLLNVHADIEGILTGPEDDFLVGDDDDNVLFGGQGVNFYYPGAGSDRLQGGAGEDIVDYSAHTNSITVDLDHYNGFADLGSGERDYLAAIDSVWSGSGDDTLTGGVDDNFISSGGGNDVIKGGYGEDTADFSDFTGPVNVSLDGQANDGAPGGHGNVDVEDIIGGDGADTLSGDTADNVLDGGPGADKMSGGGGLDVIDYSFRDQNVTANLDGSPGNDGEFGEGDSIAADVEGLVGGSGSDTLTGNASDGLIIGGDGSDQITDPGGEDFISGGANNDTINVYDGASDAISCGDGPDGLRADPVDDVDTDCEFVSRDAPPVTNTTPPAAVSTTLAAFPSLIKSNSITFTFSSNQPGSVFVCTVDGRRTGCTSPFVMPNLKDGIHQFTVFASLNGNIDQSPETAWFTVDTTAPTIAVQRAKSHCVGRTGEKIRIIGTDRGAGQLVVKLGNKTLAKGTIAKGVSTRVTRTQLRKYGKRLRVTASDAAGNSRSKSVMLKRC